MLKFLLSLEESCIELVYFSIILKSQTNALEQTV
jgi:hypothetical protein